MQAGQQEMLLLQRSRVLIDEIHLQETCLAEEQGLGAEKVLCDTMDHSDRYGVGKHPERLSIHLESEGASELVEQ